jgi:hypothetical protein
MHTHSWPGHAFFLTRAKRAQHLSLRAFFDARAQKNLLRRPMAKISSELIALFAAALLGTQATACARRDIVLGERGGSLASARDDSAAGSRDAGGATGAGASTGSGGLGAAAGDRASAAAGSAAASGKSGAAGSAAPAGNGAPVAGAAGSSPALRKSKGCGKDPLLPDASLQVSGMTASYVLDLPLAYDKTRAYPLVMAFREASTTADAFRTSLNLVPVTGSDAIVVHPNCMNDAASWDIQRDSLLVDTLLAKLEASYCIDQGRVFALGHGAGAMFTSLLGCVRGDKLRAIAVLSGAAPPPGGCVGQTAVWLLQGNMDTSTVGLGLGDRDFWAAADACDVSMALLVSPAPCVEYAGCAAGFPVRYCTYDGGPDLPSFAASAAWSFFKGL